MKPADQKMLARLVQSGALAPSDVEKIVALSEAPGARALTLLLVEDGFVHSREVARVQADLGGFRFVDLAETSPEPGALSMLDATTCARRLVLPIRFDGAKLVIAMADPTDVHACDAISRKAKVPLDTLLADRDGIRDAIRRHYGTVDDTAGRMSAEDVAIVRFEADREVRASQDGIPRLGAETLAAPTPRASLHEDMPAFAAEDFEPAKPELLEALERSRLAVNMAVGATPVPASELDARTPVATLLRSLLEDAMHSGAEVLQFTPMLHSIRVRARFAEGWRELTPYPSKYHDDAVRKLRRIAGAHGDRATASTQRRFLLKLKGAEHTAIAQFDPTAHGEGAQVLFPDNVPLLPDPLRAVGLAGDAADRVEAILTKRGSGLLLVSTPSARNASMLHGSLVRRYGGGRELVSLERSAGRTFAGATQIYVPTAELQLAALMNCAYMEPDLAILDMIESGTVLQALAKLAMRGTTCAGILAARDARTAAACLRAAALDKATAVRAIAGLLHVFEAPLLCPACSRVTEDPKLSSIPEWALGMNVPFREAKGCDACGNTGRAGHAWVAELMTPDLAAGDGSLITVVSGIAKLDELVRAGRLDPRDCP